MEDMLKELKQFADDKGIEIKTLADAAGVELSTFYRKMKKGRSAFTIGMLLGMVKHEVMTKEDAIRIFLM